jgi:uncharacterized membrane protein YphA (DoxX/SURF4 family)
MNQRRQNPTSTWQIRLGWALSTLVVLFLLFDGTIKLFPMAIVVDTLGELGFPPSVATARGIGVITLVSAILYAVPRTSLLGAVLLTALLGGAVATHLRAASPVFSHLLFGVYLGLVAWGGLYLRDQRLRTLLPFRQAPA